jgi:hypothetical protein
MAAPKDLALEASMAVSRANEVLLEEDAWEADEFDMGEA